MTQHRRQHPDLSQLGDRFSDEDRINSFSMDFNDSWGRNPAPAHLQDLLRSSIWPPVVTKECSQTGNRYVLTFRPSVTQPDSFDYIVMGFQAPSPALETSPEVERDYYGRWTLSTLDNISGPQSAARLRHLTSLQVAATVSTAAWNSYDPNGERVDEFMGWADKVLNQVILQMAIDRSVALRLRVEHEIIYSFVTRGKYHPGQLKRQWEEEETQGARKRARRELDRENLGGEMVAKDLAEIQQQSQEQTSSGESTRSSGATRGSSDSVGGSSTSGIDTSRKRRRTVGQKPQRYLD